MAPWLKEPEAPINEGHLRKFAERNSASWATMLKVRSIVFAFLCLLGVGEVLVAFQHVGAVAESLLTQWLFADGAATALFAAASTLRLVQRTKVMGSTDLHAYLLRKERGAPDEPEREGQLESTLLDRLLGAAGSLLVLLFLAGCYCYWKAAGDETTPESLKDFAFAVLALRAAAPGLACSLSLGLSTYVFWKRNPKDCTFWDDLYSDA